VVWDAVRLILAMYVEVAMNRRIAPLLLLATVIFPASIAVAQLQEGIKGKVVSVTDGDTLTVLDEDKTQRKIRLAGIDAPEKKQPHGTKAREALAAKMFG
jgi:endonuclease YncB( thermonuclease family)